MTTTATVSSKGQVTIPNILRKTAGIQQGDTLAFEAKGEEIVIRKVEPLDILYLQSLQSSLSDEWDSEADNKAYNDL